MQSEPWHPDLLDYLAEHLVDAGYDLKRTLVLIATSQAYQSRAQVAATPAEEAATPFAGPRAKRLTAEQFVDAVWQLTGTAPKKFDAPVARGGAGRSAGEALEASWIWGDSARDGGVPPSGEVLTFRREVQVEGPVARAVAAVTCDNEFRLLVNGVEVARSENWEQVTLADFGEALRPGANELVVEAKNGGAGPNPAGLFFEARIKRPDGAMQRVVSDGAWSWQPGPAAGGGPARPAVVVPALGAWAQVAAAQAPGVLADGLQAETRMVRAVLMNSDMLMRALGRPNREQIVSMRPNDLTTLEAIDLSNGRILAEALAKGAERLAARPWADGATLVRHLYLSALSRPPTAEELSVLAPALEAPIARQAVEDVLWSLCMTPEFQLVR
jgi:hypothetical protein